MHAITAKNLFRRRNPGAIHQPLQTAKNAARRLDGMACAVLVGHIGFDKTCAGAQLGSQRLASVLFTSASTTLPPASTIMRAVPAPSPEAPPVTTKTEFSICILSLLFEFAGESYHYQTVAYGNRRRQVLIVEEFSCDFTALTGAMGLAKPL